jgi:hypothetical protein
VIWHPCAVCHRRELQDATPELAARLKARQESAARTQRLLSDEDEAAAAAAGGPGWSNTSAPFGGELAALLQKRCVGPVDGRLVGLATRNVGTCAVALMCGQDQPMNRQTSLNDCCTGCHTPLIQSEPSSTMLCCASLLGRADVLCCAPLAAGGNRKRRRRQQLLCSPAVLGRCPLSVMQPAVNLQHGSSSGLRSCQRGRGSRREVQSSRLRGVRCRGGGQVERGRGSSI